LQDFSLGSFNATPATPAATVIQPTCTVATGTVNVTNPVTGYTYKLTGTSPVRAPVTSTTGVFQNVQPGTYNLSAAQGTCVSGNRQIVVNAQPPSPARPVITIQEATVCGTLTAPTITVSCPIVGTYKLSQTGETDQTFAFNGSNGPVKFTVKLGKGFSIVVTNAAGCTSGATNCNNYTTNTCPAATVTQKAAVIQEAIAETSTVTAAPSPFNDRIRFSITPGVSGRGTLDLYNLLGQKIKTVFQGNVEKGRNQTIEYSVPNTQRSLLIYRFQVGTEHVTGKLVGLK